MKKIFILTFLIFCYLNLYPEFDFSKLSLDSNVKEYTLSNGLDVLIKEENSVPLVGFSVTYKVGFRNEETDGHTGLTHLLEHMMFKGTKNYKKGEIARTFDDAGAHFNAFTAYDKTCYFEVLPKGGLETAIKVEADRMENSLLDPRELKSEINVVLSEIRRYESNPGNMLERKLLGQIYKNHPYASMYGALNDVEKADRNYVYNNIYKKYYCPNNAYIVIVGDIKAGEAISLVKKYFENIPPNKDLPAQKPNPMPFTTNISINMEGIASENFGVLKFNLPAWDIDNKDFIALSFISTAGIISGFNYEATPDGGIGELVFSDEPYYPAETIDTNFIAMNFNYFKSKMFNQELMGYDTINSIMNTLIYFKRFGNYTNYEKMYRAFEKLTPGDVINAIMKYLSRANTGAGYFKVKNADARYRPETVSQTAENFGKDIDFSDLENPTPDQIRKTSKIGEELYKNANATIKSYLADVSEDKLSNGLTVIFKPLTLNQKVSISIGIKAPAYLQKTPYQHDFAYDLVFEGGPQIKARNDLEKYGASFGGESGLNFAAYDIEIPLEKFDEAVDCIALALKGRKFMPLIMEEMKFNYIKSIDESKMNPNPGFQANHELGKMLYGNRGNGLDYFAQKEDILKKKLGDAEDFYNSFYRPENTVIVVAGNMDYKDVLRIVKNGFDDWIQSPAVISGLVPPLEKPVKNIIKKTDMPVQQSIVIMAAPSSSYADITNHIALSAANNIFGGSGLTSRVARTIRDKYGLTYSIYTSVYPYEGQDIFSLSMQNSKQDVDKAMSLYFDELKKYKESGPNELEIEKYKNKTFSEILFGYQNASSITYRLLYYKMLRNNYAADDLFINILNSIGREKIMQALKEGIPDRYFISIAGE